MRWFDLTAPSPRASLPLSPAAEVLRLVQITVLGALVAALAAELDAALTANRASLMALLSPPAHALHPFLPVFIGMLAMPTALAAIALALGSIYRATNHANVPAPSSARAAFGVAVRGTVPLYGALVLLPLPGGGSAVALGASLSVLAWAGGYARVIGVRAGHGAKWFGIAVLAVLSVLPMIGALLATLA